MAIDTTIGGVIYGSGDFNDHVLNDMLLSAVADTIINPNALLRKLPRDKTRVQGKNVVYPIHTERNLGVNAVGPDGFLPDPGQQAYDGYSFPIRHLYGRIKFDGISMDASAGDVASWLRVVTSEVQGLSADMARERNRIFNNDGSGRIGEVVSVATNVVTCRINGGVEGAAAVPTADFAPTKFVKTGQRLFFADSAGASGVTATVDATTPTTDTTFDLDSGTGVAANDWIMKASRTGLTTELDSTSYQREAMGLAGIFSDADPADGVTGFQGILSATGDGFNQANILDNGAVLRPLTESLMQQAFSDGIRVGEAYYDCLFGSFGIVNTYINLLIGDKRFVNTTDLPGGSKAVTFNGIPLIADRDAYSNRLYYMDTSNMRVYVMADPQWMNYDGSSYHRLDDKDAYQATLFCRETLGVDVRDKCTLLGDLTEQ